MRERKPKGKTIHRRSLFGGKATAEEVHAQYGFRRHCEVCHQPPVIRVKMFMLMSEFANRAPDMAAMIAMTNPDGDFIPTVPTKFGPMVKFSDVTACRFHKKELELAAAKAPSWVLVEIDRGAGADKPIVQVC
jgi:hypothetical protein